MSSHNPHRQNLIDILRTRVQEVTETVSTEYQAFVRLAGEWLGYDLEEEHYVDGAEDRGVDFWYASDTGLEVFQVKSHEMTSTGILQLSPFGSAGVLDLQRIALFLKDEHAEVGDNTKLKYFRQQWEYAITRKRMGENSEPFHVGLGLVVFGEGLTTPAQSEFVTLCNWLRDFTEYQGVPVEFRAKLYTIDDLIDARWRQDNREWKDKSGRKKNTIDLHPEVYSGEVKWVSGRHNAVFYCRAIDLILAFEDFGYQIFEPNVRAHISKSRVNEAIKHSLLHQATRKEFQFLNNGVTIICKSYSNPTQNRPSFRASEPGIVNGLQTVVALHNTYFNDLNSEERTHLEKECYVLVRLLRENAVRDVNKVVLASNTQNPMQARNLRSNTSEQILFERLFAGLGWFYERKQGAWEAFSANPSGWRTLHNCRTAHFRVDPWSGRPKYRRLDNEEAAQTWLAFVGFSDEAVHKKKYIFEEDEWYTLIFLSRTTKHAAEYNHQFSLAREEWLTQAPSHAMMLVSYLARQYARAVTLSGKENRELACQRLNIDPQSISKEELEVLLAQDSNYVLELVLSAMTFVFVEFLGYLLFKALKSDVHDAGFRLLQNGSLKHLYETADFETVAQKVRTEQTEADDVMAICWHVFRHTVDQLMAGPWRQSYQAARSRTRFNHSVDTRTRIYREANELNKFMEKGQLTRAWAAGIPSTMGLYQYLASICS